MWLHRVVAITTAPSCRESAELGDEDGFGETVDLSCCSIDVEIASAGHGLRSEPQRKAIGLQEWIEIFFHHRGAGKLDRGGERVGRRGSRRHRKGSLQNRARR